mgnify:CR=1 FL=1
MHKRCPHGKPPEAFSESDYVKWGYRVLKTTGKACILRLRKCPKHHFYYVRFFRLKNKLFVVFRFKYDLSCKTVWSTTYKHQSTTHTCLYSRTWRYQRVECFILPHVGVYQSTSKPVKQMLTCAFELIFIYKYLTYRLY